MLTQMYVFAIIIPNQITNQNQKRWHFLKAIRSHLNLTLFVLFFLLSSKHILHTMKKNDTNHPLPINGTNNSQQVELSFKTGEVILVYGDMDEDGFFMGELDGVRGLVPSNFLTEAVSANKTHKIHKLSSFN